MTWLTIQGQFRTTLDFMGASGTCVKISKIPHYGFTLLSLDLTLSPTCYNYVSAKFPPKDLLGQSIFCYQQATLRDLSTRDLLK